MASSSANDARQTGDLTILWRVIFESTVTNSNGRLHAGSRSISYQVCTGWTWQLRQRLMMRGTPSYDGKEAMPFY